MLSLKILINTNEKSNLSLILTDKLLPRVALALTKSVSLHKLLFLLH